MYFGLRNAAQTFQRFIDEVLRDMDFCYAYIDDVIVISTSEKGPTAPAYIVSALWRVRCLVNPAKCVSGVTEVIFLGYTVSAEGTRPMEKSVAAINRFKLLVFVKDLRRLIGMLKFTGD
jgi:hypothetical protein